MQDSSARKHLFFQWQLLPAQVTVGEPQRDQALALRRQVPAARVKVLQSSRPTLSVPGLSREGAHAPQLHPPALRIRSRGGRVSGTGGESEQNRTTQQQQQHHVSTSCHPHLSAGRPSANKRAGFLPAWRLTGGHEM